MTGWRKRQITQYQEGIERGAEMLAKEIDRELLENLKAGEKVTCDDTEGYSIGTREAYEEFVKKRNYVIEEFKHIDMEKALRNINRPGKNSVDH